MASCMGGDGEMTEDSWGGSFKAPSSFIALNGTEELTLPATVEEISAYLSRNGAVYHSVGRREGIYRNVPPPREGSPCQMTDEAIIFSFGLQESGFIPRYVAYVTGGRVVCIDRQFSYSGT